MRKIKPLNALVMAKAKQRQSPLDLDFETRACLVISIGDRMPVPRNHISSQIDGLTDQTSTIRLKPAPPLGAKLSHPEIKVPQQSTSHTWSSTEATPTAGSR
jgi:hypothetical protein